MSHLIATASAQAAALRYRHDTGQIDRSPEPRPSRVWTLIEALAYAGAFIDPSGILAVERLRRAQEEERRDHR